MRILQSRSFANTVKKFSKVEKLTLDDQIKLVIQTPNIGKEKKGDLRGVFVHKFKIKTVQYLLAYRYTNETFELIMIGLHENYYRDLKKSIKSS